MKPIVTPDTSTWTRVSTNRVRYVVGQAEGASNDVKDIIISELDKPLAACYGYIEKSELMRLLGLLPKHVRGTTSYLAIYHALTNPELLPSVQP